MTELRLLHDFNSSKVESLRIFLFSNKLKQATKENLKVRKQGWDKNLEAYREQEEVKQSR